MREAHAPQVIPPMDSEISLVSEVAATVSWVEVVVVISNSL